MISPPSSPPSPDPRLLSWVTIAATTMGGGECTSDCSGHGDCINGTCLCQIRFEGSECGVINFSYHVAFASIFSLLALTSLIQLVMCIHAEYLRMKKNPSIAKACRVTTQKLLYFLIFLASLLRSAYFAAPTLSAQASVSLMSAYYPLVLTGSSLIVCFWAEVFHLREIRWERPRFLSKSFLGFLAFNIITYSLLTAELFLVWAEHEHKDFYTHIFNGCYAVLMFVVVVFFLIYGVEVFFKVRGGFTLSGVPDVIASTRTPIIRTSKKSNFTLEPPASGQAQPDHVLLDKQPQVRRVPPLMCQRSDSNHSINTSQLHQSRLGLLSQALMMIITVGFLFSETLEKFWKTKVDLSSRNTHDVIFRTVEIGVALWFPCVLWNCIRPEQLWCLNPKKILNVLPPLKASAAATSNTEDKLGAASTPDTTDDDEEDKSVECWICYDSSNCDVMISPCNCKGDVGSVHHDCLRRWLVESADNPGALRCKVCNAGYMMEKGSSSQFSLAQGFTLRQWASTVTLVSVMCATMGGCWAVIKVYPQASVRMLAVGAALLVQYLCLRYLGLNTVTAYQRAKVSALKIVNLRRTVVRGHAGGYNLQTFRNIERSQSRI